MRLSTGRALRPAGRSALRGRFRQYEGNAGGTCRSQTPVSCGALPGIVDRGRHAQDSICSTDRIVLCRLLRAEGRARFRSPRYRLGEAGAQRAGVRSHCHKCHPGGEKGLGFAINKPLPDFLIKAQVRAGAGAMPAFSKELLTGEDLDHVVAYIDLLRRQ